MKITPRECEYLPSDLVSERKLMRRLDKMGP
jgi:hypothetical protein